MAGQSITFDFISRGGPALAADFKRAGDNAAAAARGAKVLQTAIDQLGQKENRTAAESATLAKALKLTGDAEDRAAAKALAADIAIRRLDDSMAGSSKSTDRAGGGFLGLTGAVTGFGDASAAASGKSTLFQRSLAGLNLASGVLEPAMAGVVVAAGGTAAAFASAGLGMAAFGAVAGAVLTQASAAATKYTAAQAKLGQATDSKQRVAALQQEKAALAGLDASQRQVVFSIISAQNAWQGFTRTATPGVAKVLAAAVGLLPEAFGLLRPFLAPAESALTGIIGELRAGVGPGSQFAGIMGDFAAHSGKDLTLILATAGHLFMGVLGAVHAFLPEGGNLLAWADQASAKFAKWGDTLSSHTGFQSLMTTFRTETPQAMEILKNLGVVLVNVGKSMFGLSTFSNSRVLLAALLPLSGVIASLSRNQGLDRIALYLLAAGLAARKLGPAFLGIKAAVAFFPGAWAAIVKFSGAVEGATAKEVIAAAATKVWAGAQAVFNAVMDANPIILVAVAAAALGAAFYLAWQHSAMFRDVIKDIGVVLLAAGIIILKENKIIVDSFLSVIGTILHGMADAFGWIPGGVGNAVKAASRSFDGFKAGTDAVFDSMIGKAQDWQTALNKSKVTVATATASIVSNFRGQGAAALVGRDDVTAYTTAVQANGSKSDAARSARTRLITDLENSGVSAKNARTLVDQLQTSISSLHGKNVLVGANATASGTISITGSGWAAGSGNIRFHAAQGAYVNTGSGPTADDNLARVSKGELIVPAGMVRAGAVNHLRGKIPGFASGGFVGLENSMAAAAPAAAAIAGNDSKEAVTRGVAEAVAAAKAAVAGKASAAKAALGFALLPGGGAAPGSSAASAQAWARAQLAGGAYGWGIGQFPPLLSLWNQESGWRWNADNPSSGAYGIPQSLPADKMASAGADWRTNAATQMRWGMAYIRSVYGSPSGAWAHEVSHNWYDRGGLLMPGLTLAYNGTGRPEQVIPAGRGGAAGGVHLEVRGSGSGTFDAFLLKWIQEHVRVKGGGSVQTAFGRR
jgi:hypothetical protein